MKTVVILIFISQTLFFSYSILSSFTSKKSEIDTTINYFSENSELMMFKVNTPNGTRYIVRDKKTGSISISN